MFPRPLLLQSKSLRPLPCGEFAEGGWETQWRMRKIRILCRLKKLESELKNSLKTKKPTRVLIGREFSKWSGLYKLAGAILCCRNGLNIRMLPFSDGEFVGAMQIRPFEDFQPKGRQKPFSVYDGAMKTSSFRPSLERSCSAE